MHASTCLAALLCETSFAGGRLYSPDGTWVDLICERRWASEPLYTVV
jgi:hypothetical protein